MEHAHELNKVTRSEARKALGMSITLRPPGSVWGEPEYHLIRDAESQSLAAAASWKHRTEDYVVRCAITVRTPRLGNGFERCLASSGVCALAWMYSAWTRDPGPEACGPAGRTLLISAAATRYSPTPAVRVCACRRTPWGRTGMSSYLYRLVVRSWAGRNPGSERQKPRLGRRGFQRRRNQEHPRGWHAPRYRSSWHSQCNANFRAAPANENGPQECRYWGPFVCGRARRGTSDPVAVTPAPPRGGGEAGMRR
jgi:hypothetical protein